MRPRQRRGLGGGNKLLWIEPFRQFGSDYRATGKFNDAVVSFSFDPQGAVYFGELTGNNKDEPLAIVLDGRVISAPNINERIGGSGVIEGGQGGFKPDELNYLVKTLAAGSLPALASVSSIRRACRRTYTSPCWRRASHPARSGGVANGRSTTP